MNNLPSITGLKEIPELKYAIDSLITDSRLDESSYDLLLSTSILLTKDYQQNNSHVQSLEFAYWIILSCALRTRDYLPLYDFAASLGLYPICDTLTSTYNMPMTLGTGFTHEAIRCSFANGGIVSTLEQSNRSRDFAETASNNVAFLAPTSFGKSKLILDRIRKSGNESRTCIVVPTKSLLSQTASAVRESCLTNRLITHDEMYNGETAFLAVLTQERALRLLEANKELAFDELYIDEAHHLFDKSSRTILLTRLIQTARRRNEKTKLFYLSPVVADVKHLTALSNAQVQELRIRLNMKEPRYRLLLRSGELQVYNRFFNEYLNVNKYADPWACMIEESSDKNLIYVNSPKKIQSVARKLALRLPSVPIDRELSDLINVLGEHVHEEYDVIECIKHGVLYLHGQMPDRVKDYLEHKFNELVSLRHVVANSVVLEGVNLPIDSIFILSSKHLNKRNLINLIGRASRLNRVFGRDANLSKLMPKVVFIDNDEYDRRHGNMKRSLERLRATDFKDEMKNPVIKKIEGRPLDKEEETVVATEEYLIEKHTDKVSDFISELYRLGFAKIYQVDRNLAQELLSRLDHGNAKQLDLIDLLDECFISGLENKIRSEEFLRLKHAETRSYYKLFLEQRSSHPLHHRVESTLRYFRKKASSPNPIMYVGASFGERSLTKTSNLAAYVNLSEKATSDLVSLAIAKIQNEENFCKYTLSSFIELLWRHSVIDNATYNYFTYGTNEQKKIELCRAGLPLPLINRLEADNQLENISKDSYGNLIATKELGEYSANTDDFVQFEIEKYLM